jgi:DNA mismatch repair ATPase MutS
VLFPRKLVRGGANRSYGIEGARLAGPQCSARSALGQIPGFRAREQKKSEASGEGPERLAPYLIQEQVQQSEDSQKELYLAKCRATAKLTPWRH